MVDPNITQNISLNETIVNATASTVITLQNVIPMVLERMWQFITSPFLHTEMLWILIPLAFTLLVTEFYFERNKDAELGWGAAVANSLVLIFVAIDLTKTVFPGATPWQVLREIVLAIFTDASLPVPPLVLTTIIAVGAIGIAITVINYFHLMPRQIAFIVSGHPPINFLAFIAIAIVYSAETSTAIPLDTITLVAALILFGLLYLAVFALKKGWKGYLNRMTY